MFVIIILPLVLAVVWCVILSYGVFRGPATISSLCQIMFVFFLVALIGLPWRIARGDLESIVAPLAVGIFGPIHGMHNVLVTAERAPDIAYASSAIGAASGICIGAILARRGWRRLATSGGILVASCVTWITAETATEFYLRTQAQTQFPRGYCLYRRLSVPQMIEEAQDYVRLPNAALLSGGESYFWSFAEKRWLHQTNPNLQASLASRARCGEQGVLVQSRP